MIKNFTIVLFAMISLSSLATFAQESLTQTAVSENPFPWELDFHLKGGFNLGGSTPMPLPEEIRVIRDFNPSLAFSLEANAILWLGKQKKWGMSTGLRYEIKGMKSSAEVKNYQTEIIGDQQEHLKGYFTGSTTTNIKNSYLTLPLIAVYQLGSNWTVSAGPYFSVLLSERFKGTVYDGYLREPDPTGNKTSFSKENGATFDFSHEINSFQWGGQWGTAYRITPKFQAYTDFTWGFNNLFKDDFDTISFNMYTLNLNLGIAYHF